MLRSSVRLLALVSALAGAGSAQCLPYGSGCGPNHGISCGTTPNIGTTMLFCARPACASNQSLMLIGSCASPSLQVPVSATCFGCTRCFLDVFPVWGDIRWPGVFCLGVAIPRDLTLVGQTFCAQNVCVTGTPPCVCLSNTIQVRILR